MATRFSTRLPNAGNESGLGKDMQDFETSVLLAKTIQSVRVVGNVGLLMLGNPTRPAAQDDLLFYNLSVARAVSASAEVVGEFVGRANFAKTTTPGAEDRGLLRFGARYTHAGVRLDGGILLGLTPRDPEIGFTAGFTWVFNAVTIPDVQIAKGPARTETIFCSFRWSRSRACASMSCRGVCANGTPASAAMASSITRSRRMPRRA